MAHEWTDEQKLQKSEHMKELWKKRAFRRKVKEGVAERRTQGKNLVNIAQMESDQNYRDYQRLQHRDWYDRNREKWNAYNKRHKMRDKSTEELVALRDKHLANAHFIEELLLEREQNDA